MKLSNRFKEEDKQIVWQHHPYCVICKSNDKCSLHHIFGCKEKNNNSIINSIMLCHKHHKEADGHNVSNRKYQSYLFSLSIPIILNSGYKLKKRDALFYQHNKAIINKT